MERIGKNGRSDLCVSPGSIIHYICICDVFFLLWCKKMSLMLLHQSPPCDPPTWGTLRSDYDRVWRSRLPGEDGGGASQCFTAQPERLGEAKSPQRAYWPVVWQKTAGNCRLQAVDIYIHESFDPFWVAQVRAPWSFVMVLDLHCAFTLWKRCAPLWFRMFTDAAMTGVSWFKMLLSCWAFSNMVIVNRGGCNLTWQRRNETC